MKIGPLHITWQTSHKQREMRMRILVFLQSHPDARGTIARLARSEVKNYLAELAEEAGIPFGDPAAFMRVFVKSEETT